MNAAMLRAAFDNVAAAAKIRSRSKVKLRSWSRAGLKPHTQSVCRAKQGAMSKTWVYSKYQPRVFSGLRSRSGPHLWSICLSKGSV
jgi:hypothetical protein